jgi:tRNA1(Val) A37 N6-methylase TrmN6
MQTTCDAFLNGDLQIIQPLTGHRSGMDAVMLAAHVRVNDGESLADLGAGVGAAGLCAAKRVSLSQLSFYEIDENLSRLSLQNAVNNGFNATAHCINIISRRDLLPNVYDHVICNPPYNPPSMQPSPDEGKRLAHEGVGLEEWVKTAAHLLKAKGWLTLIDRPERLGELLKAFDKRFGNIEITPVFSLPNKPALRILIRAQLGSKTALHIAPALTLP